MNISRKFLVASAVTGFGLALAGCTGYVAAGGPVYGPDPVVYGPGYYGDRGWYHDGAWMNGPRGYAHVNVHPVRGGPGPHPGGGAPHGGAAPGGAGHGAPGGRPGR